MEIIVDTTITTTPATCKLNPPTRPRTTSVASVA